MFGVHRLVVALRQGSVLFGLLFDIFIDVKSVHFDEPWLLFLICVVCPIGFSGWLLTTTNGEFGDVQAIRLQFEP